MTTDERALQRLLYVAGLVFVVEAATYSVISPLLAHYRLTLGLSENAGGVMTGVYAAGLIPGALIGARLGNRFGVRGTLLLGVCIFAAATAAFGLVSRVAVLDVARGVQGLAAGAMWGSALAWLIQAEPPDREGRLVAAGIGFGALGLVLGPVLGTLAVAIGTKPVFLVVAAAIASLGLVVVRLPAPPAARHTASGGAFAAFGDARYALVVWTVGLAGAVAAGIAALVPPLLVERHTSSSVVGLVFLVAAVLTFAISYLLHADRLGTPLTVLRAGLGAGAVFVVLLGVGLPRLPLALLAIVATAAMIGAVAIPSTTLLTQVTNELGISPPSAAAIFLITVSVGEAIGAPATTGLATATTEVVPFALFAALVLLTVPLFARVYRG